MSATRTLMELDPNKYLYEHAPGEHTFGHKDLLHLQNPHGPTGISTEEGEFLYGLIRLIRPEVVVETGTNVGISASYICLGLKDNGKGHLTTIEKSPYIASLAHDKLTAMGFNNFEVFVGDVNVYKEPDGIDFLWLDTELNLRYAELLKYYSKVVPGGIICIHDLYSLNWKEFGGVPNDMQNLLKDGSLRALTFATSHGVTAFQKRRTEDYLADLLAE